MSIFYSKEKDGTLNVHVSGYVTKDPKVTDKVVLFSVCYGKQKYMDCKAWGNETAGKIAACLERHDAVSVDGVYEEFEGRDGQLRKQISVDGIFPMIVPAAAPERDQPKDAAQTQQSSTLEDLSDSDPDLPF